MYGIIGKMLVVEGKRQELIGYLLAGSSNMPGCLSYIIAEDSEDSDALWITEVWESKAAHAASLQLPAVKQAIENGRSLIAGFGDRYETTPVGGFGLHSD